MPVLMIATYNSDGSINVMNAAWGTMVELDIIALNSFSRSQNRSKYQERRAFTVSIADAKHWVEADYFGIASGNNRAKKFEKVV